MRSALVPAEVMDFGSDEAAARHIAREVTTAVLGVLRANVVPSVDEWDAELRRTTTYTYSNKIFFGAKFIRIETNRNAGRCYERINDSC